MRSTVQRYSGGPGLSGLGVDRSRVAGPAVTDYAVRSGASSVLLSLNPQHDGLSIVDGHDGVIGSAFGL